jgi:hypothetical protein
VSQIPFFIVQVSPFATADRLRLVACAARRQAFPTVNAGLIRITEHGPVVWVGTTALREEDRFLLQEAGFSAAFTACLDKAQAQARRFAYVLLDEYDSLEQALSGLSCLSASANRLPA